MIYLEEFTFPDADEEFDSLLYFRSRAYSSYYPFGVLSAAGLRTVRFEPVTILYGGNGSGKTTALNVIAEHLGLQHMAFHNRTAFTERYTHLCRRTMKKPLPPQSQVLTSDDVFDFMLDLRAANQSVDRQRETLFDEWAQLRRNKERFQLRSMDDYEQLRRMVEARRRTQSAYVRQEMPPNVREHSNGESAFLFFTDRMEEKGFYLLDEPENSLSPAKQRELASFIADSARFFGCQIVMATHSPFLLAIPGAVVWDLDARPAAVRKWTELEHVRAYRDFFESHRDEFPE